jgi:hypothetical protein
VTRKKLVEQAGVKLGPKGRTVGKSDMHGLEFDEPPRHRAEADARRLALASHSGNYGCPTIGDDTHTENPI